MRVLFISMLVIMLAGCGTMVEKVASWSGHAAGKIGELIYPVQVVSMESEKAWLLKQHYDEPPVLDGFQMDYQARELCPEGYVKEEVYALRPAKFEFDAVACVSEACRYTLVWKVRCDEMPQEPFSIFGKF